MPLSTDIALHSSSVNPYFAKFSEVGCLYFPGLTKPVWLSNQSERKSKYPSASYTLRCLPMAVTPQLASKRTLGLSDFPFFVVIMITPFADLAPKTAAEEASFKTSTCSISWGLISDSSPKNITLSTTIKGSLFADNERWPRTCKEPPPFAEELTPTFSPGTPVRKISCTVVIPSLSNLSGRTWETAPVRSFLRIVP